jgi:hypothetical protein
MTTLTIRTQYPCCGGACRLRATLAVPAERYTRRCRPCETTWDVKRRTIPGDGVRIDVLEWLDTHDRLHYRTYGS